MIANITVWLSSRVAALLVPVYGTVFVIPAFLNIRRATQRHRGGDFAGTQAALRRARHWWRTTLIVEVVSWTVQLIVGIIALF